MLEHLIVNTTQIVLIPFHYKNIKYYELYEQAEACKYLHNIINKVFKMFKFLNKEIKV